jgi:hypothetical protein
VSASTARSKTPEIQVTFFRKAAPLIAAATVLLCAAPLHPAEKTGTAGDSMLVRRVDELVIREDLRGGLLLADREAPRVAFSHERHTGAGVSCEKCHHLGVEAGEVPLFIGAGVNPFARPYEFRAVQLKKKVDAGADFVQTQGIFDMKLFKEFMKQVCDLGIPERCKILAGVLPLKTFGMTRYMAEKVPGVVIPEALLMRMSSAPKEKAGEEGIRICLETIEELRTMEGIARRRFTSGRVSRSIFNIPHHTVPGLFYNARDAVAAALPAAGAEIF